MGDWLNVCITGGSIWPTKETEVELGGRTLILKPATKETEQSAHINLRGIPLRRISHVEGMTLINRFLSVLAWCDGAGMKNEGGVGGSVIPAVVPKRRRSAGSSLGFPNRITMQVDSRVRLALALYREGLTVNSVPFSFLSYFKILNVFWEDKFRKRGNQGRVNPLIEGIRETLPKLTDKAARDRIVGLEKTEQDVPKYLYESGRCAVAHAYAQPIVDPDDNADSRRLSQDIWIIRAIAEHLIEVTLQVPRSIFA